MPAALNYADVKHECVEEEQDGTTDARAPLVTTNEL